MKKLLTLMLALSVLFMTSCGNAGVSETGVSETTEKNEVTTSNTTKTVSATTKTDITTGDLTTDFDVTIHFEDYQEYVEYFEKNAPDNFVHYEEISEYGDFMYFCTVGSTFDCYFYSLLDADGHRIRIKISNYEVMDFAWETAQEAEVRYISDMSTCKIDTDILSYYYIKVGELIYWYFADARLFCVAWEHNGLYFQVIASGYDYEHYIIDTLSDDKSVNFILDLLHKNKAEAAVAEFNSGISN